MALNSMTGFGAAEGQMPDGTRWRWEVRSVNGRGLDLRFRLPEGHDTLEPSLRKAAQAVLQRGSVTASLRLWAADAAPDLRPDMAALGKAIETLKMVEAAAAAQGLALAPVSAEAVLRMPGVLERHRTPTTADSSADSDVLIRGFDTAVSAMLAARKTEGAALRAAMATLIDGLEEAHGRASAAHADWAGAAPARLRERVATLSDVGNGLDAARLAQEVALLTVKMDVREELDRLAAHIRNARALLADAEPVGRRLDFLAQEFNREANTLCAKSDNAALTDAGLMMKVLVDRLREQAQNVE
jgi:uncharacterized protein (TIGR00255 family)